MSSENLDLEFLLREKHRKDTSVSLEEFDASGNGNHEEDEDLSFLLTEEPLSPKDLDDDRETDAEIPAASEETDTDENHLDDIQFDISDAALNEEDNNASSGSDERNEEETLDLSGFNDDTPDELDFDVDVASLQENDAEERTESFPQSDIPADSIPEPEDEDDLNLEGWFTPLSETGQEENAADSEVDISEEIGESQSDLDASLELKDEPEVVEKAQPEELPTRTETPPPATNVPVSDEDADEEEKSDAPVAFDKSTFQKSRQRFNFSAVDLFETGSLLGLDIGSHAFKYVHLKKTLRGFKLLNCGNYTIPQPEADETDEERRQRISEILQQKFKNKKFRNEIIVSAVSGIEVLFQNVQVPQMGKKELQKAVPWACRKDFPFPIEESIVEFLQLGSQTSGKLDAFVVAAKKDAVIQHLDVLKGAQITPDKVTTVPAALWTLFRTLKNQDVSQCVGLLDIGARSSHIAFVNGGELQFAREITTGGDDFTQALADSIFIDGKEIELSDEQAETLKRRYGIPRSNTGEKTDEGIPLQEIAVMTGPVLERLVSEIKRTRDFFEERFRVETLNEFYITGGGAQMPNLGEVLEKELEVPVKVFNPFEHISLKKFGDRQTLLEMGTRFAVATGLALDQKNDLNLLPDKMKSSGVLRILKKLSGYLFLIFLLAMALMYQSVSREIKEVQRRFREVSEKYQTAKPKRERFLALQKELAELKSLQQRYNNTLEVNLSSADHMKVISNLFPRNITLTSLRINYKKVKIKDDNYMIEEVLLLDGVAFENNSMEGINLAQFLLALEKSRYFSTIALKNQTIRQNGSLAFTIECII